MLFVINLPDNRWAVYMEKAWTCRKKTAVPMLEYFTKVARLAHPEYSDEEIVRAVVAMISGCLFLGSGPESEIPNLKLICATL